MRRRGVAERGKTELRWGNFGFEAIEKKSQ